MGNSQMMPRGSLALAWMLLAGLSVFLAPEAQAGDVPPPPPPPPLGDWEGPAPADLPAVRDVVDAGRSEATAYTQRHDWSKLEAAPASPGAIVPPTRFHARQDVDTAGGAETGPSGGRIVRSYFTPSAPTAVAGACDPCKKDRCNPCCCGSPWMIGLYATSSVFEDPTGILGEPLPAGVTPFNFATNEYDPVGGARVRVLHRRGCTDAFEFRGTFYGKADAESRQTGQFAFSTPAGISPVATATVFNESLVWGFDINYWRTLRRSGRWHTKIGAGWRYLRIDEKAQVKDWNGRAALTNSFIGSDVDNALFAAQLMAGVTWRASNRFELMADAKVLGGVMASDIQINETSILSGGSKSPSKDNTEFAWGVEATLEGRLRITGGLWLRGGAEVLFIDGVQGATDAFDFSQSATGAVQPRVSTSDRVISTLFLGLDLDL